MAVTNVERQFTDREAEQGLDFKITTTSLYLVEFNSLDDGEQQAATAQDPLGSSDERKNIPKFGQVHPNIPGVYASKIKPRCSEDSPYIWYVSIDYSSAPSDMPQPNQIDAQGNAVPSQDARKQQPANPTARQATWEVTSIDREEPVREWTPVGADGKLTFLDPADWEVDHIYTRGTYVKSSGNVYFCIDGGSASVAPSGTGDPDEFLIFDGDLIWLFYGSVTQVSTDPQFAIVAGAVNSGNCPFDPPQMTTVSIPVLRVTKYLPIDGNFIEYIGSLKNAVNVKKWKGLKPRVAKIISVAAKNATVNEQDCVEITWEIGIDPDTWDVRILDAGYGYITTKSIANPLYPGTIGEPMRITKRVFVEHKDPDGTILSGPVPMNGKGGPLDPDSDPVFLRGVPRQQKLLDFNKAIFW